MANLYPAKQTLGRTQQRKKDAMERKLKADKEKIEKQKQEREKDLEDVQKARKANKEAAAKAKNEARKNNPSIFPAKFDEKAAATLIASIDFKKPQYVESNEKTRRAFVHYVRKDSNGKVEVDCWIGANGHKPTGKGKMWTPGHSYILEYDDFQIETSPTALAAISALPDHDGDPPAIL